MLKEVLGYFILDNVLLIRFPAVEYFLWRRTGSEPILRMDFA